MTMMTIAICDDMQADARKLHKQLERIVPGSEIRIFKSGELLLEELEKKRKPYDAIFVNMDSKKVDGLETIRKIREREMSVAVIFMSRSDEYYRDAFDLFAYNYLLKPVTAATLEYIMEPLKKRLNINTDEKGDTFPVSCTGVYFTAQPGKLYYQQPAYRKFSHDRRKYTTMQR